MRTTSLLRSSIAAAAGGGAGKRESKPKTEEINGAATTKRKGDVTLEIEELEWEIERKEKQLKRMKEKQNKSNNEHEQEVSKRPSTEMGKCEKRVSKYMLKLMEVCKAQGYVYGIIQDGKPILGASDNLLSWWAEEIGFCENGPSALREYLSLNSSAQPSDENNILKIGSSTLLELHDLTLGPVLSALMRHCNPPQRAYPLEDKVAPPWWPSGEEEWWTEFSSKGAKELSYKKPHDLKKPVKAGVLKAVIQHMMPEVDKILKHVKESKKLQDRLTLKECKIFTAVLNHELNLYRQRNSVVPNPIPITKAANTQAHYHNNLLESHVDSGGRDSHGHHYSHGSSSQGSGMAEFPMNESNTQQLLLHKLPATVGSSTSHNYVSNMECDDVDPTVTNAASRENDTQVPIHCSYLNYEGDDAHDYHYSSGSSSQGEISKNNSNTQQTSVHASSMTPATVGSGEFPVDISSIDGRVVHPANSIISNLRGLTEYNTQVSIHGNSSLAGSSVFPATVASGEIHVDNSNINGRVVHPANSTISNLQGSTEYNSSGFAGSPMMTTTVASSEIPDDIYNIDGRVVHPANSIISNLQGSTEYNTQLTIHRDSGLAGSPMIPTVIASTEIPVDISNINGGVVHPANSTISNLQGSMEYSTSGLASSPMMPTTFASEIPVDISNINGGVDDPANSTISNLQGSTEYNTQASIYSDSLLAVSRMTPTTVASNEIPVDISNINGHVVHPANSTFSYLQSSTEYNTQGSFYGNYGMTGSRMTPTTVGFSEILTDISNINGQIVHPPNSTIYNLQCSTEYDTPASIYAILGLAGMNRECEQSHEYNYSHGSSSETVTQTEFHENPSSIHPLSLHNSPMTCAPVASMVCAPVASNENHVEVSNFNRRFVDPSISLSNIGIPTDGYSLSDYGVPTNELGTFGDLMNGYF